MKAKTGAAIKTPRICIAAAIVAPNHLRIGEYHPHFGGHLAGLMRGETGQPDYYLFVSPKAHGQHEGMAYGGEGVDEPGAAHDHDGLANTLALVNSAADHPAAKFARDLTIDGFADYYLPSREELRLAYANCRDLFDEAWYWSSTQYGRLTAWNQGFSNGTQGTTYKAWKGGRVRAVRRILISH